MSTLKYLLFTSILTYANLAMANGNSDSYFTPERKDKYLCKYSHLIPSDDWFFGYKRRDIRFLSYAPELNYYKKVLKKGEIENFNSLTTSRMTNAFHFDPKKLQSAAKELGYHRNAYERYSVVRLLARKKIENLLLGLDEAVNYLRWSPTQHPDFVKKELGFFKSFFYEEPKKPIGRGYEAFSKVPKICLDQDGYINTLKITLQQKRIRNANQTNTDNQTGDKFYPNLSANSKIYQFEQKKSLYSFQLRLKNSFFC